MNNLLTSAVINKEKLEIIYISNDGKVSQRFLRVLELRVDNVLAYCYYRKRVRAFKIENILSLQKAGRVSA